MPQLESIEPKFNPTGAPESEVYARGKRLHPDYDLGWKPHSDFEPEADSVEIARVMEKEWVTSGMGLIASKIALENTLGDFDEVELVDHMASTHERRMNQPTPFISFASDLKYLAERIILRHGYGLHQGQEGVVVHAKPHPSRLLTPGPGKHDEVLLVGGVAPDEFVKAQGVEAFVREHIDDDAVVKVRGKDMTRDEALEYWKTQTPRKMSATPTSTRNEMRRQNIPKHL